MTAEPPPGWYPDPGGGNTQRYFDGTTWTDQLAPFSTPPIPTFTPGGTVNRGRKSPRRFVILAIAGFVGGFVTFVLMQLAFSAASEGSGALFFEIVGFALFIVWLVSIVATVVGVIGAIVRAVQ